MRNGRYYVQPVGASEPRYVASILSFTVITGIESPIFIDNSPSPAGKAWGASNFAVPGGLIHSDGFWRPSRTPTIRDVSDISTAPSNLWMVKTDGTVWTTSDAVTQLRRGPIVALRIAAAYDERAFAVAPDGRMWQWHLTVDPAPAPHPAPPVPPSPPQASATMRPRLSASTTGGGAGTVIKLDGDSFLDDAMVTVRGVRLGDGTFFEWYWITHSDADGKIAFSAPVPCVPGITIHFSANDGRRLEGDVTERLWNNVFPVQCPAG